MAQSPRKSQKVATCDPVWSDIVDEAKAMAAQEPDLAGFLHAVVLNHERLEQALSFRLSQKLGSAELSSLLMRQVFDGALAASPDIGEAARADAVAVNSRDPACRSYLDPLLYFKGFHALQAYRIAHWLWNQGRTSMALYLQNRISEVFGVDIHPAALIGRGIFIDHATSIVIGETAVVEDDVSMLHEVTLGGTGKETGDRHPKVRKGAMISAGAKILGNIEVGESARVGAGSVVLKDVPAHSTVAGVPAKVVGIAGADQPSHEMDQNFLDQPDYSI
ncbi:MAG: serine O-acetyltransferase [Alphaproteobacteria bacterium]